MFHNALYNSVVIGMRFANNQNNTRTVVDRSGYKLANVNLSFLEKWRARALHAESAIDDVKAINRQLREDRDDMQDIIDTLKAQNAALKAAKLH